MIHNIWQQIAHLSTVMTLVPGDLIATGTCAGVGIALGKFLQPGDVVRGRDRTASATSRTGSSRNPERGPAHESAARSASSDWSCASCCVPSGRCSIAPRGATRRSAPRWPGTTRWSRSSCKDGSIGRHFNVAGGRASAAAPACTRTAGRGAWSFKDVATALAMMKPEPRHGRGRARRQELQGHGHGAGPRCASWWMQTAEPVADRGLQHGHADARRQHPLHDADQRRAAVRVREGRPHRARHADRVRRAATRRPGRSRRAGRSFTPRRVGTGGAARAGDEVGGLFATSASCTR